MILIVSKTAENASGSENKVSMAIRKEVIDEKAFNAAEAAREKVRRRHSENFPCASNRKAPLK